MSCKFKKIKHKIDEIKDDLYDFGNNLYEEINYEAESKCFWPPINSFVGVTLMTECGVIKNISGRFCGEQKNDCSFDLLVYQNGRFFLLSIPKKDVITIKVFPLCPYNPC